MLFKPNNEKNNRAYKMYTQHHILTIFQKISRDIFCRIEIRYSTQISVYLRRLATRRHLYIASITIDTVSFYSYVCQLYWNDKFACRRASRSFTTIQANLVVNFSLCASYCETSFTTMK